MRALDSDSLAFACPFFSWLLLCQPHEAFKDEFFGFFVMSGACMSACGVQHPGREGRDRQTISRQCFVYVPFLFLRWAR